MNARYVPATEPQLSYLEGLRDKLSDMLDDGSEIIKDIDTAIDRSNISKRDAGRLIDQLLDTLADLTGQPRRERKIRVQPQPNVVAINPEVEEYRARRAKEVAAFRERQIAYTNEQSQQFNGAHEREAPTGLGRTIKVWKKYPNDLIQGDYHGWEGGLNYGWVWECTHESHKNRKGQNTISGRSHRLGFRGAVAGAVRHWCKFHMGDAKS